MFFMLRFKICLEIHQKNKKNIVNPIYFKKIMLIRLTYEHLSYLMIGVESL